jgi:hypothetical protein
VAILAGTILAWLVYYCLGRLESVSGPPGTDDILGLTLKGLKSLGFVVVLGTYLVFEVKHLWEVHFRRRQKR